MSKPEFAATRYYALAFWAPAVTVTYLPIWLNERGISDAGIGLINTLPMAGMLLFSVLVGRLADRAPDWKQAIMLGTGFAAFSSLLLGLAEDFWMILLVWTMATLPAGLVSPVADAATMRLSLRLGFSFGAIRAWGTIGFLAMCFVTGYVVLWLGASAFVWLIAIACFSRFFAAVGLPRLRDADQPRTQAEGTFLSREVIAAFRPWVLLPVIAGAILFANHMVMNAFSSLVWKRINIRFPARVLILMAGVVSVIRWIGMTLSPPLWVIVLMQLGQAVTFTFSYLGCLYFIAKRTSEDISAEAQSLFGVMMQGFSILIVASFGIAFGVVGVNAFWICVALSALAILMVQVSLRMRGPDPSD